MHQKRSLQHGGKKNKNSCFSSIPRNSSLTPTERIWSNRMWKKSINQVLMIHILFTNFSSTRLIQWRVSWALGLCQSTIRHGFNSQRSLKCILDTTQRISTFKSSSSCRKMSWSTKGQFTLLWTF